MGRITGCFDQLIHNENLRRPVRFLAKIEESIQGFLVPRQQEDGFTFEKYPISTRYGWHKP
jgi:hypothetical protein